VIADFLFDLLIPQTKFGLALWGVAMFIVVLIVAALMLGWVIIT
jgi:hypothetical protein